MRITLIIHRFLNWRVAEADEENTNYDFCQGLINLVDIQTTIKTDTATNLYRWTLMRLLLSDPLDILLSKVATV